MVEINSVKEVIKDYIVKQLISMGESSPAIRLLTPLAKRAIMNNIDSFDKFLKPIADKDGMIDIEGILNLTMLVIVVAVIKIFLMNFVNFLMRVEDEVVVVVEVA